MSNPTFELTCGCDNIFLRLIGLGAVHILRNHVRGVGGQGFHDDNDYALRVGVGVGVGLGKHQNDYILHEYF